MSRPPKFMPRPIKAAGSQLQVQAALMQAVALQQQGKLDEARALYGLVLQLQPSNFDALHLMGVVAFSAGYAEEAAGLIGRALAVNPNNAAVHHNHGAVMTALHQHEAAAQSHLRAAALNPGFADAHCAAANALATLGRHPEALGSYNSALAACPDFAQAWANRGNVLAALGQLGPALGSFGKAIDLQPGFVDAYDNRGLVLHGAGRFAEALDSHDRALALSPDRPQAHFGRGNALQALGRHEEAVASYDRAILLRPTYAMAYYNRGLSLISMKLYEKAVASYDHWLAYQPQHPEALNNRGIALRGLGRHQAALESYERALAVRPTYADAWSNHGVALSDLGRFPEALHSYERVLAMNPDDPEAHLNRGIWALQSGDFELGWADHEWRLKCGPPNLTGIRDFPQPWWSGAEPLDGKTILLQTEQGLGDTLQFSRYVRKVAAQGGRVILEVQPPLLGLLQELEGVSVVVGRGQALPPFDCHCALMSLPLAFKTLPHTIPPVAAGLLGAKAVAGRTAAWETRLGIKTQPRVGMAWSGSPTHKNDHNRSIALRDLLAALPKGVQYVSLQREVREADAATLAARPDILHWGDELQDFTDTAALCGLMDLVISVDTSVAHLAGTLRCKTWVLLPFNPDCRWMLDRTDTPWYPTAVLYRQPTFGDWETVLRQVGNDLASTLAGDGANTTDLNAAKPDRAQSGSSQGPTSGTPARDEVSEPAAQIHSLLVQALDLQQQGKMADARALFAQVLQLQPDSFDALHLMGVADLNMGQIQSAADLIARAVAIDPNNANARYNHAIALGALGQREASADSYLRAGALNPGFAEVHCSAGIMLSVLKRHQEALASYDKAVAVRPDYAQAWTNRGNALAELGKADAALASYNKAIELRPDVPDGYSNRGNILRKMGQYSQALESYDRALVLNPSFVEALINRSLVLHDLGRYPQALESHDRALALKPDHAQACFNRGNTLVAMKQHAAAVASYDRAVACLPGYAAAWYNRGIALAALKRHEEALASCDKCLAIQPRHAGAMNNRGLALRAMGRSAAALESFERALVIQPDYAEALNNRGISLSGAPQHFQDALESFERALTLKVDYPDAHSNRGVALTDLGRHREALVSYERALALNPDYADAHWNLGLCLLQMGEFARGWQEYEWRWKREEATPRSFTQPLWLGEQPLEGRTMLLHAEQGLGDTLQFSRYAQLAHERGARVILEVQAPLLGLLQGLEGVSQVLARGSTLPPFHLHCPLMSLPLAFRTTPTSLPPPSRLETNPGSMARWETRLGPKQGARIGLVWSGSSTHKNDLNRSIALADLFVHLPRGPQYVSLQKEVRETDRPTLDAHPELLHFGDELHDFTETAALCALMDGVISVDTSVAHLAGTLGCKLWLLLPFNPDWRWMLERTDSPWYPSAVLCRQSQPGDWSSVLAAVGEEFSKAWT